MKNSTVNFIERLISSEEFMAETINTEHEDFEGSSEQNAFALHQNNIVTLEKIKSIVEQSQQLKQHNLELMAQVERLRHRHKAWEKMSDQTYRAGMTSLLQENPQQSLAEHDAEVVSSFGNNIESIADKAYQEGVIQSAVAVHDVKYLAEWYANQLRQQADKDD